MRICNKVKLKRKAKRLKEKRLIQQARCRKESLFSYKYDRFQRYHRFMKSKGYNDFGIYVGGGWQSSKRSLYD